MNKFKIGDYVEVLMPTNHFDKRRYQNVVGKKILCKWNMRIIRRVYA